MTKQYFIEKWIGWVSYTDREKLYKEMEADLESVSKALRIHDVVGRSEQLVAVLKTVKGITIPDTDEGVDAMVKKYSN